MLHGLDCKRLLKKFGQADIQLCILRGILKAKVKILNVIRLITVEQVKHPIHDRNSILTHL